MGKDKTGALIRELLNNGQGGEEGKLQRCGHTLYLAGDCPYLHEQS